MKKYSICFENSQFENKPMKIMKQNKSGNVASNSEVAPSENSWNHNGNLDFRITIQISNAGSYFKIAFLSS